VEFIGRTSTHGRAKHGLSQAKIPKDLQWCVPRSLAVYSAATRVRLASRADQFDPELSQALPERIAVMPLSAITRRVSAVDGPPDDSVLLGSPRASSRRVGLPRGMQSEGSFPEEDRRRRPPPTSSPCPAWFFRLRSPFFRGGKTPVQK
jgi:hypothetical protein